MRHYLRSFIGLRPIVPETFHKIKCHIYSGHFLAIMGYFLSPLLISAGKCVMSSERSDFSFLHILRRVQYDISWDVVLD
jgi:hypothetical protein